MPIVFLLLVTLLLPSLAGGLVGAFVLVHTPPQLFDQVVPYLVLFATVLFALRDRVSQWTGIGRRTDEHVGALGRAWGFVFQFGVAVYQNPSLYPLMEQYRVFE
jgi:uncharacterized membrane protein YfcA